MRRILVLAVLIAFTGFAATAVAQDSPAPAPAAAKAAGDATSAAVTKFFVDMAQVAADNKGNCPNMGTALNTFLNDNEKMLRDAAYSASSATSEEELQISTAATDLGTHAGVCYQEEAVTQFFDRFVTLTRELDT